MIIQEKILDALKSASPEFQGIKFFIDYLKNTYDEDSPIKPKPSLFTSFCNNVKNIPSMPHTEPTWEKILATGDTHNAFITAFDWDLSPEGYAFWDKVNTDFAAKYSEATINGMNYNQKLPKILSQSFFPSTTPYEISSTKPTFSDNNGMKKYANIQVMPSSETLKLMSFLSPNVTHVVNPQINTFNDVLDKCKCKDEFYKNLRNKPKHDNYKEEFKKFTDNGDLRSIIYWAFNWSSTEEGFDFWSNVNAKVHSAITQELMNGLQLNPYVGQMSQLHQDPITHLMSSIPQENNKTKTPMVGNTQHQTMVQKHQSEGYYPHSRFFYDQDYYDDYCGGDYDDYYDAFYGYGGFDGGCYSSYSTYHSVPKDIVSMPTNKNYISVKFKEKEVLAEVEA